MQFDNQKTRNVADAVTKILAGEPAQVNEKLHPNQQVLDVHEPEKDELTAKDFEKLRAKKKEVKKEEVEQIDEAGYSAKAARAGEDIGKPGKMFSKIAASAAKRYGSEERGKKVAGAVLAKLRKEDEDLTDEQIDALILEYESKDGVYTHKGTYGTAKGAEYGSTDWKKENEMAKSDFAPKKPARKKYGARQNYVRSTRVNESFSSLLSVYKEQGLKGLAEVLVKEEPTNAEYDSELNDAKAKAEGKKKQPELAKGSVQAVKQEETEIAVIDANKVNGVKIDTIDERQMTEPEMKKREEIVKSMKKGMAGFKERYGERAKSVMYATAAKIAKEKA